jgi:branched-chain amino acid transport system substrate-binding protein
MRLREHRLVSVGAAAAAAVLVGACGSGSGTSSGAGGSGSNNGPASGTPIQIGFESDLSAQFAANGNGLKNGFQAYFNYMNNHGGFSGHPVNVTALDDAAQTARGTADVTQLITQTHVTAIGGFLISNVCGAAAPLAKNNKVPILCNALSADLLNPAQQYVYSARIAQVNEAKPMTELAKTLVTSPSPKVGLILLASAASTSLHNALKGIVSSNGWNLVDDETVALTASDVSAQTSSLLKGSPDVIIGSLPDALATLFVRSLAAQGGSNVPFIDYDGATAVSLTALKNPNYYVSSAMTLDGVGSSPQMQQYDAALSAAGLKPTDPFVNVGYVEALIFGEALKSCGFPCSGAQLQGKLDQLDVDTGGITAGNLTFTSTSHEPTHQDSFYAWDTASNAIKAVKSDLPAGSS